MFVLVSEVCVPLHHPALLWAQLIAESHVSRVAARRMDAAQFDPAMVTPHLRPEHLHKSSQWVSLTRMHAALAAEDEHVWPQFERFCRSGVCHVLPRASELVKIVFCDALRAAAFSERRPLFGCQGRPQGAPCSIH